MYPRSTFTKVAPDYIEQLEAGSIGAMKAGPSEAKKPRSTTPDMPADQVRVEQSMQICLESC